MVPPTDTVTVMVCGASIAFGSVTVTMPVKVPDASVVVENAMFTGVQVDEPKIAHGCTAPIVGTIHGTEEDALSAKDPVPAFVASIVCAEALAPVATVIGPTAADESRSLG